MKYIGAHVSSAGGPATAVAEALKIGANAFALFTRNQKSWTSKPFHPEAIEAFRTALAQSGIRPEMVLPHDSYLINLGSPDPEMLLKSRNAFLDEMVRADQLGLCLVNFHPGSHLKQITPEQCLDRIAESINLIFEHCQNTIAVIENTAGQGSNMGYEWQQIARIIRNVKDKSRIGVCIDTCHAYSAGYDLATEQGYEETFLSFDREVGLQYLKAIHLNDSKKALGSRVDRHESLRLGTLGEDFFRRFMRDPRFDEMPIVLETPDESRWADEIAWLRSLE